VIALVDFLGGIVFTSHDRHFIEALATTTGELRGLAPA
jgi:ATPase subunit of ABC transporter with duplicated ATPase domains